MLCVLFGWLLSLRFFFLSLWDWAGVSFEWKFVCWWLWGGEGWKRLPSPTNRRTQIISYICLHEQLLEDVNDFIVLLCWTVDKAALPINLYNWLDDFSCHAPMVKWQIHFIADNDNRHFWTTFADDLLVDDENVISYTFFRFHSLKCSPVPVKLRFHSTTLHYPLKTPG